MYDEEENIMGGHHHGSNPEIELLNNTPDDVKSMVASTFLKSFNSMPKWLRWGTIIAVIVGVFYFTVAQKYITQYRESNQIEILQTTVSDISQKVKNLEEDHQDAIEIYQNFEEVRDLLSAIEEAERKRSKNLLKFIKKTHNTAEFSRLVSEFEDRELEIDNEYEDKVEEIFNEKLRKRMEKRKIGRE